jgi:two-component system OmpR family sensor kinase
MNVRQKISILITAAGFLSSLVFSCIILWEMMEQPFRIIDSELETAAQRAVSMVLKSEKINRKKGYSILDDPFFLGDDRYWLKIYDQNTGQPVYQSHLATQIDIPEQASGASATIGIIIPEQIKIHLEQNSQNEVTFRVKGYKIALDGRTFLVSAARPMEKLEEEIRDTVVGVAGGLAFSVLLLMAISYFVAGLILRPVRAINDQARDITEKHLDRRIPVSADRDEFSALARTLNQVFDRLQHAFLRQKQLLADASHELKTPLTMMRLALDEISAGLGENQNGLQTQSPSRLTEQVLRMERLVKNLLDLSSLEIESTVADNPVDITNLLDSLITDYRFMADARKIRIDTRLCKQIIAMGNAEKLNRAFSNILDNAIKYNVDGGRVEVVANQSDAGVTVTVTNTGPGVAENDISKVFDQFYRVEGSRSTQYGGTGLGLAIVKRIIELHEGKVKLESAQGDWTQVTVSLPIADR